MKFINPFMPRGLLYKCRLNFQFLRYLVIKHNITKCLKKELSVGFKPCLIQIKYFPQNALFQVISPTKVTISFWCFQVKMVGRSHITGF